MPLLYHQQQSSQHLIKRFTFTGVAGSGAVGQATVVTPTGQIFIKKIVPVCVTDLVSGGGGTLTLGYAGSVAFLIGVTIATDIDSGQYWLSAAPAAVLLALPSGLQNFICDTPITMDILIGDITAGVLVFDIEYESINGGILT